MLLQLATMTTRVIKRLLLPISLGIASVELGPPSVAQAQAPSAVVAETMDHDALFQRGLDRYDAKDYAGAVALWEHLLRSLGEQRGWKVLYNLGLAHQASGDATRAIERFDAFLLRVHNLEAPSDGPIPPELAERRDDAAARASAIRATHGAVRAIAPRSAEVVMVRVGTAAPRAAGFTLYLAPGPHEIEIETGTPHARRITVQVTAGGSLEVDTTRPAPATAPTPAAPRGDQIVAQRSSFPTGWFVAGAGLTAASVILPVALGLRANSLRDDAEKLGPGHTGYAAAAGEFDDARDAYRASFALPAVLAAATLAIPILYFTLSAGDPPQKAVSLQASSNGEGGSLWARGRF
jgi:tetratricopeptide (TPR) repeat protein